MQLGRRLAIAFTSVTASIVAVSFVGVFYLVRRDELGDLDRALVAQARASLEVVQARGTSDLDGLVTVPEELDPLPRYVAVYGTAGVLEAASLSFKNHAPPLEDLRRLAHRDGSPLEVDIDGEHLRGLMLKTTDGRTLLYAASRRAVDADERFLVELLGALFALAVGATTLAAFVLGARLSRDVQGLAAVARAVSDGQLDARAGKQPRYSTELRALAGDLDLMIERLGALVVAQRTFVSHAAHELRSPLAALRGELQLALRRSRSAEEYQEMLAEALTDVEDLVRLTEDLLTLAHVQGSVPGHAATRITDILDEASKMARGRAKEREVEVVTRDETNGTRIRGGRDIARALRNLVDNAVTHSPSGSRVEVVAKRSDGVVEVSVRDQGSGISDEDRDRVFSPFFRGAQSAASGEPGAGLGLAIARGIARTYGGDVDLGPKPAKGAEFVLRLVEAGESTETDAPPSSTSVP